MIRAGWIVAVILVVCDVAASAWGYTVLPDRVPTHWNFNNEVDGYGSKWIPALTMPLVVVGMMGLFAALPALSPRGFEVDSFRPTVAVLLLIITGLLSYLHAVILYATWNSVTGGAAIDLGRIILGGILGFFALIGNFMGKVHKNFYIGVRLPWTLASDRVWNDTHRLAAWLWTGAGAVGVVLLVLGANTLILASLLVEAVLVPAVYSYVHYKTLERRGAL